MIRFEKVKKYADIDLPLPSRGTANSAGYDFVVAEDVIIPPIVEQAFDVENQYKRKCFIDEETGFEMPGLKTMAEITKATGAKPTLVSTGMKCYLDSDKYLELSVRSSTPLKHWLILANGVGIIDADYADNPDNEGEIFFQIINLNTFPVKLYRGDKIGQGIIKQYLTTDDDSASGARSGGFGSTTENAHD